jgi:methanogenic corrinoid protein MtbC1
VEAAPPLLAEEVATVLDLPSFSVIEVVRLHLEALDSALALDVPELLGDQLRWQRARLRSLETRFDVRELDQAIGAALTPSLEEGARAQVSELYGAAHRLVETGRPAETSVRLGAGRANDYLTAALGGRREEATQVVQDALDAGVDVAEIMLTILQPAHIELGRLWQAGQASVAQEHYTTAVTQLSLALLFPRLLRNRTLLGHGLVATSVASETHELGIRMISDLLLQAGWGTTYLGADVPHDDVVDTVARSGAEVLAVSATMAGHVPGVRDLVLALRTDPRCAAVRVLVGGRLFTLIPRLAATVGADGWAPDAQQAIGLCRGWIEGRIGAG